ncbi:MAG: hypothetical protein M3077_10890 [Candidatus Dormibacteraeota bacterium]|nr:hypothetical protein [Candidatus Dormibacteraeota bacterium]
MIRIGELDQARQLDIVLAEDDPDLATLHQAVLEGAGHHVEGHCHPNRISP